MRLTDSAATKLEHYFLDIRFAPLALSAINELLAEVLKEAPPPAEEMEGELAAAFLERLIPLVQTAIIKKQQAYGAVQWLWYLRRMPEFPLMGSYHTTLAYDLALAESLSWYCPQTGASPSGNPLAFKCDESVARHLARFIGRIKLLSQLHIAYRRVGKGSRLTVSSKEVRFHTDAATEAAINLYDERHDAARQHNGGRLGIAEGNTDFTDPEHFSEPDIARAHLVFGFHGDKIDAPTFFPHEGRLVAGLVAMRFILQSASVDRIIRPFLPGNGPTPAYVQQLSALVLLLILLPSLFVEFPWAFSTVQQRGYFFTMDGQLRAWADKNLEHVARQLSERYPEIVWPGKYDDWINSLNSIEPNLWPLKSGGVLRKLGEITLIDFSAATSSLLAGQQIDRDPAIGNVRAGIFEDECQEIIDASSWIPPDALKQQRRKQLRRNGNNITDVDAIGCRDGQLLLVSCKSLVYDGDYDKGVFRVVKNLQSTIDKAVADWNAKIEDIRNNPRGDNFDFSGYREIHGVVCTPFVAYSNTAATLQKSIFGWHACASAEELRNALI